MLHIYIYDISRLRVNSPDDGHVAARNVQRIEINIHEKALCVKFVVYKDYTEMHDQQNIKYPIETLVASIFRRII